MVSHDGTRHIKALSSIASRYSPLIEVLKDGVLFDVSGLTRLIGGPDEIYKGLSKDLKDAAIPGKVAVTNTSYSSVVLARHKWAADFDELPLSALNIEKETLNVLKELGLHEAKDLKGISPQALSSRFGSEINNALTGVGHENFGSVSPNIKKNRFRKNFFFDHPVYEVDQILDVFESLLEELFIQINRSGLSTDHIDVVLKQRDRRNILYELRASFPTVESRFWRKLLGFKFEQNPSNSELTAGNIVVHSTGKRTAQSGLYARSKYSPEELDLTLLKLKGLVGSENVGIPVLIDEILPEPFRLENRPLQPGLNKEPLDQPLISFTYYRPPLPVKVTFIDRVPITVDSYKLKGRVVEYGGEWIAGSCWWSKPWKASSWDIELDNGGLYLLSEIDGKCLLIGEYD